jgi:xanthine dehydrogenase molybdenum-binding subunit
MLHARLLRSPYPHARVVRVDTGRAERLPGVVAILTKDNTTKVRYTDSDTDELNLLPFPPNLDQVLFDERVRYAGEPVAAVAATSAAVAEQALELIEVEYEQLPAVFDAEAALAPDAPRIHDHVQGNLAGYLPLSFGDVEAGFREADLVVEETFRTARQKHCQMEPQAVVASYDRSGKLTLWSGTQTPHLNKQKLAKLFGLPQSQVRVINPHIGGAFGANLGFTVDAYAAALAIKTGRPVRLALTREEVFVGTSSRHPMVVTLKLGFKRDGTLTAPPRGQT